MITKIERKTKKRQKLKSKSVCSIIEINFEVTGNDKLMGSGCSKGYKKLMSSRKTKNGLE